MKRSFDLVQRSNQFGAMKHTIEQLRELVSYDREAGKITRNQDGVVLGYRRGGTMKNPYEGVSVEGVAYYTHRLAWALETGAWPAHQIDHRDHNRQNNRWDNLREATHTEQMMNRKPPKHNKTGLKGVCRHKSGLYGARIRKDGRQRSLGYYACPAAAHFAYVVAADNLFGEFARFR